MDSTRSGEILGRVKALPNAFTKRRNALPDFNIDFSNKNANSEKDRHHCMDVVHFCMWKGRYSLAIANMKASTAFFDGENTGPQCSTLAARLRELESVFKHSPLER